MKALPAILLAIVLALSFSARFPVAHANPFQPQINKDSDYLALCYNPEIVLVCQNTSGNTFINFSYANDTTGTVGCWTHSGIPQNGMPAIHSFEPPANSWPVAWDWIDNPPTGQTGLIGHAVLSSVAALNLSRGFVSNWKSEVRFGIPIPYGQPPNDNVCYPMNGPQSTFISGAYYLIGGAAPFVLATGTWASPNLNPAAGICDSFMPTDEALYQALNFKLRGDNAHAASNVQCVANRAAQIPGGRIAFGTSPYRGEELGLFMYVVTVLGSTPTYPAGTSKSQIEQTLWSLQNANGGIARAYTDSTPAHDLNPDHETSATAILYADSTLIAYFQSVVASGIYSSGQRPPTLTVPLVDPFQNPPSGGTCYVSFLFNDMPQGAGGFGVERSTMCDTAISTPAPVSPPIAAGHATTDGFITYFWTNINGSVIGGTFTTPTSAEAYKQSHLSSFLA
jgi:hypothetical protein